MRQEDTFVGQPIRSLQTMLKTIARCDCSCQDVVPDGIYGKETASAVSKFQKTHGMNPTGAADRQTWEAIAKAYDDAVTEIEPANSIEVQMNLGQVIKKGERHPCVLLAQAMLNLYADAYDAFLPPQVTGVLDAQTQQTLEAFQMLTALPMTGTLDKTTWKHLVSHFPAACGIEMGCFCKEEDYSITEPDLPDSEDFL